MDLNDHEKGNYVFFLHFQTCWAVIQYLSLVLSVLNWIHRQGCSKLVVSASSSSPIVLSSCVELLKRLYYKDLVVVGMQIFSVFVKKKFQVDWVIIGEIQPSEVIFDPSEVESLVFLKKYWFLFA